MPRKFTIGFFVCCLIGAVFVVLATREQLSGLVSFLSVSGIGLILLIFYVLPGVVAVRRNHHQAGPIIAINLLLGWTFLGWVIAFAMSLSSVKDRKNI